MEEGAINQGMQMASKKLEKTKKYSPPEPPEGMQLWQHLDFSLVKLVSDF